MTIKYKTIHLKVKPEAYPWLNKATIEVNDMWNYCKGTPDKEGHWNSGFDLCYEMAGFAKKYMHRINSACIQMVCKEYALKRRKAGKHLRGRNQKSLGWVPFKKEGLQVKGNCVRFSGKTFRVYDFGRLLEYGARKSGSFSQNSLGEWFLNVLVEIPESKSTQTGKHIGIDLGLKTLATCSDGTKFDNGAFYRQGEAKLSNAMRRGHKKQAKRISATIRNQRQDALHKISRKLVDENDLIIVGDVSSAKLAKTKLAKSVNDAGWYMLKMFCQYKSDYAGKTFRVIDERYTTQACSNCGCITGPRGLRQLAVRDWVCSACGTEHDRDINSAKNILNLGLSWKPPFAGTNQATA